MWWKKKIIGKVVKENQFFSFVETLWKHQKTHWILCLKFLRSHKKKSTNLDDSLTNFRLSLFRVIKMQNPLSKKISKYPLPSSTTLDNSWMRSNKNNKLMVSHRKINYHRRKLSMSCYTFVPFLPSPFSRVWETGE